MPAVANLVMTDRAATPVAHTFVPGEKAADGTFELREALGVPLADNVARVRHRRTATGKWNTTIKVALPIVQTQTINGVSTPVVVRTSYINVDITFDASSTLAERNDAAGMLTTLFTAPANSWLVSTVLVTNENMR